MLGKWLLALAATGILAQESNDIGEGEDPGSCVCDLTANSCDSFCCCDPDCGETVVDYWEDPENDLCAPERFTSYANVHCIRDEEFYLENARRGMKVASDGINKLLCVEIDNSPTIGKFYEVLGNNDISNNTVESRITEYVKYSDKLDASQETITRSEFLPQDIIGSMANGWSQYGYSWPIPAPDGFGYCNDMNSARWLVNDNPEQCLRIVTPSEACDNVLNSALYTDNLMISEVAQLTQSNFVSVSVNSVYKRDLESNSEELFSGSYASSSSGCSCFNALLEAHYTLTTNSEQNSVSSVSAEIVVGDLSSCDPTEVAQKFSVRFFTSSEGVKLRSGNPGYQTGLPVILASKSGNELNVYEEGFKLDGVAIDGKCDQAFNSLAHSPIFAFRQEIVLNCYLEFTFEELQNYCTSGTPNTDLPIFSIHKSVTHIGKFGNIEYDNEDDFVQVQEDSVPETSWNEATGTCSLPNLLIYNVVTLEVGSVTNPQTKIVNVKRTFEQGANWVFKQKSKSMKQKFMNTLVINYIPYDEETDFYSPPAPNPIPVMPDDILYPFRVSSSRWVSLSLLVLLFLN